jgi:hypothetical protein
MYHENNLLFLVFYCHKAEISSQFLLRNEEAKRRLLIQQTDISPLLHTMLRISTVIVLIVKREELILTIIKH